MKFLFDLGGVFFDWDPEHFYKNVIIDNEERDYFLKEVCNDEWNLKQDAGRSINEAINELLPIFPQYEREIKMYYDNHRKMIKGVFDKSIDVLKHLKNKKFNCYVLSNWSAETFINMTLDFPFLNMFDDIIISGKEKMIKPNRQIYELAINRFNLNPKYCVFIDDKIQNIDAAKDLDFQTIHLTNPLNIKENINLLIKQNKMN